MDYIFALFTFILLLTNEEKICNFFCLNYKYIVLFLLFVFSENIEEIYEFLTKIL